MAFLSKLYAYKQSADRGAFEDFLTELLAEWLRLADQNGYSGRALQLLFMLPANQLPSGPITWSTQHVIPQGYGKASRRKPDLAGSAPGFLLLIENKVSAGFTSHYDDAAGEETLQLDLYQSYLDQRVERGFNETGRPVPFNIRDTSTIRLGWYRLFWSAAHHLLRGDIDERRIDPQSAFGYLTSQFVLFLEERGMGSIDLQESDMVALPAMRRLETAFGQIGALAVRESTAVLHAANPAAHLAPCGNTIGERGDFRSPWFYGEVMTKDGEPFNTSAFVAWAGVMTADVDWIIPMNSDVPEVTVGLAVWCDRPSFDGPGEVVLEAFQSQVEKLCQGSWSWQRLGRTQNGPVMVFSSRVLFTDAWAEASALSWDDWAAKFFRGNLSGLLETLNTDFEGRPFGMVLEEWIHHP